MPSQPGWINSEIENDPNIEVEFEGVGVEVHPALCLEYSQIRLNENGYQRGIRLFNAREFFDAHEVWEDVWRETNGVEKRFLQGLIQAAVAFHHLSTGNVVGACSLMERARKNLAECPTDFGGIGVGELIESLVKWRTALNAGESAPEHPKIIGQS